MNVLSSYLNAYYVKNGRRLDAYDEANKSATGYLRLVQPDKQVEVLCGRMMGTKIDMPILGAAEDWQLLNNMTMRATLKSEAMKLALKPIIEFNKGKREAERLFDSELLDLAVLPPAEVPPFCVQYFEGMAVDACEARPFPIGPGGALPAAQVPALALGVPP